jgi:hypothetical protein
MLAPQKVVMVSLYLRPSYPGRRLSTAGYLGEQRRVCSPSPVHATMIVTILRESGSTITIRPSVRTKYL